ncbi:hypothetical protein LCGC14_0755070 [marine sediment metagenome]|uniref:Uncharacterized protein n=1 Tax=marine sediment metagenome TaxID=412755 RepID=A0A0F9T9X4_9ZZZZ
MTQKLGLSIALTASRRANMMPCLAEMFAFEQACGIGQPGSTFYHYCLTDQQMQHCNQYRLILKTTESRLCLSQMGRDLVRNH